MGEVCIVDTWEVWEYEGEEGQRSSRVATFPTKREADAQLAKLKWPGSLGGKVHKATYLVINGRWFAPVEYDAPKFGADW